MYIYHKQFESIQEKFKRTFPGYQIKLYINEDSMTQHDFIIFEPIVSTGVLKINDDQINYGIVKSYGYGYYDTTEFIPQIKIAPGYKIIFTNYITLDIEGEKLYVTRGRDVIRIDNANQV